MMSGLNNQRICLLNGMALAKLHNWTFVLPDFVVEYNAYQDAILMPFKSFYNVHHTTAFAHTNGFRAVEGLPQSRHAACMLQLQHHRAPDTPDVSLLNIWGANHGVVCLTANNAFILNNHVPLTLADVRLALRPAKQYEVDIMNIVTQMVVSHNTSTLPAVHVRVQPDWVASCPFWPRTDGLQCMVDEEELVNTLQNTFHLPEGCAILVISDTTIEELPALCHHFKCISKAELWVDRSPTFLESSTTLAFVDFVLACKMELFLGNIYSTFSREVVEVLNSTGQQGVFYNPLCLEGQVCN